MEQRQSAEDPTDDMFDVIKTVNRARLGRLSLQGRSAISTPHFLGITSRGVVPHITQDNFASQTDISGVYVALEDCESPSTTSSSPSLTSVAHTVVCIP
jgi:queuine tRNA-ribosyltransferase